MILGALVLSSVLMLLLSAPRAQAARPHLSKAGIACSRGQGNTTCLLFIRAKHAGRVQFKLGHAQRYHGAAHWGRDVFGARRWYSDPVDHGDCLEVRAVARARHGAFGQDHGKVRLCDAGWGPATSAFESAWTYADYHRF